MTAAISAEAHVLADWLESAGHLLPIPEHRANVHFLCALVSIVAPVPHDVVTVTAKVATADAGLDVARVCARLSFERLRRTRSQRGPALDRQDVVEGIEWHVRRVLQAHEATPSMSLNGVRSVILGLDGVGERLTIYGLDAPHLHYARWAPTDLPLADAFIVRRP